MVGDMKTDGAVCVGPSIRMVMKCKPHKGERKTDEQKQDSVSTHRFRGRCRDLRRVEAFPQG
jgi:hypothetical protein